MLIKCFCGWLCFETRCARSGDLEGREQSMKGWEDSEWLFQQPGEIRNQKIRFPNVINVIILYVSSLLIEEGKRIISPWYVYPVAQPRMSGGGVGAGDRVNQSLSCFPFPSQLRCPCVVCYAILETPFSCHPCKPFSIFTFVRVWEFGTNKTYREGFLGESHGLKSSCELFCFVSQNCKL